MNRGTRMIDSRRYALGAVAMVAMLTGCGGTQPPMGASPGAVDPPRKTKQSQTFNFTGAEQTFMVPTGVTRLTITASGASGGADSFSGPSAPGGVVTATVHVTPGESLAVFVGGQGSFNYGDNGGYNGGGNGAGFSYSSSGGGGASDVRQGGDGLQNRIIIAGGGGGQGCCDYKAGGPGGGRKGGTGSPPQREGTNAGGGKGGTQQHGGSGGSGGSGSSYSSYHCYGANGKDGTLGDGGDGALGCQASPGGGGGGGYYGGGGGGGGGGYYYGGNAGAGGGGSSYAEPHATHVMDKRGAAQPGNGQVIISWH